jgi:hypothetical protein
MELTSLIAKVVGPTLLVRFVSILLHRAQFRDMVRGLVALILFPAAVAGKARILERAGFLNIVLVVCLLVGGYFTWFGYFASTLR